jgi:DNA end-binding protein Ku
MARSIWRGVVSFGLVSIPIRLYLATESKSISFNMLHAECLTRVNQRLWCPFHEREVTRAEIVKGYEWSKGEYVVVDDEDLENLPLATTHAVEILDFVERKALPPGTLFVKQAYYFEPEETGRKPYVLMRRAMEETDTVAIGKVALRDKEHLAAISIKQSRDGDEADGTFLLNTLYWPDEIRTTSELKIPTDTDVQIQERELKMAVSLVENLISDYHPEQYKDNYREALLEVINAKIEGRETAAAPVPQPKLGDLLDQLKASVEATKKRREEALAGTKEGKLVAVEGGKGRKARAQADEAEEADEKAAARLSRRTRTKADDREEAVAATPTRRRKTA